MPGGRQTPTGRLRRLAAELRSLRTSSGLTRDEIVERTGINVATLYRIEHARVRPQTRTLRTLLDLYRVEGVHQDELVALLRDARQRGWLHAYQSVLREQFTGAAIPDVVYIDSMAGELFWKKRAMSAGISLCSSISAP
jgi:transcriptional regulator with XRE-family HTH domain